jgi:hypothetical protein
MKKPPPLPVTLARLADFIARGQRAQQAADQIIAEATDKQRPQSQRTTSKPE